MKNSTILFHYFRYLNGTKTPKIGLKFGVGVFKLGLSNETRWFWGPRPRCPNSDGNKFGRKKKV